jgi:hypothetical protein
MRWGLRGGGALRHPMYAVCVSAAHWYFSLLNYLFCVFLCRSNPGVHHLCKLAVSVLFFDSE